jgi:hypothetical protein
LCATLPQKPCTAPKHPAAGKVSHVGVVAKFKSGKTVVTAEAEAEATACARDARSQGAGAANVDGESQADLDARSGAAREEVAGVQRQDIKGRQEGGFLLQVSGHVGTLDIALCPAQPCRRRPAASLVLLLTKPYS